MTTFTNKWAKRFSKEEIGFALLMTQECHVVSKIGSRLGIRKGATLNKHITDVTPSTFL